MKAIILAGGKGTRLRPLTYAIPKPLLPIGRKPILEIIIEQLRKSGFLDIILTVQYKAELIEAYFRDGSSFGVNITYIFEKGPSGTAGPLRLAEHLLTEPFVAMNGDLLTKLNFGAMYEIHLEKSAELTVGMVNYSIKLPYGLIDILDGKIVKIQEKPELNFCVNAGIYIISPSALDIIPKGEFFDMPDMIQMLIDGGRKVETYPINEYWRDIGRMEDYEEVNAELSKEI
jgi:NDP-sugar pyrophosphorylase family protein